MKTIVKFIWLCLIFSGCSAPDPAAPPSEDVRTVTGYITEIEDDTMSLRTADLKRQFIFSLENPPVAEEHLREHMDQRLPVRVSYRNEGSRLIPITIDDA